MAFASLGISQNILLCSAAPVIFWQRSLFPSHYVFLLKFPFKEWFIQQGKGMTQLPPQFPSFCKSNTLSSEPELSFQTSPHSLNCFLFLIPVVLAVSTEMFAVPIGFLWSQEQQNHISMDCLSSRNTFFFSQQMMVVTCARATVWTKHKLDSLCQHPSLFF